MEESKCKCSVEEWDGRPVPRICESFIRGTPFKDSYMCANCLHGENCHATTTHEASNEN